MADIFLSYAQEDVERIRPLAEALKTHGWSVFWERTIPVGESWVKFIGTSLAEARCVVVVLPACGRCGQGGSNKNNADGVRAF